VVIIDHGRVVLAVELDALRSAAPQRMVDIRYSGTAHDWTRLNSCRRTRAGHA
jgi:hypothetical protein